jgi:hypothetical protein
VLVSHQTLSNVITTRLGVLMHAYKYSHITIKIMAELED